MFQKQMSRTKNIIKNKKRLSAFNQNNINGKTAGKSYFSSHKNNPQENVSSSQIMNRQSVQAKNSFRNSQQE